MPYKFNPLAYDMLSCVECGTSIPLTEASEEARVQTADGAREVPGLWVCKACESHVSHVEQTAAFIWLTGTLIPQGLTFAMSAAKSDSTDLGAALMGLMIAEDVQKGNDLAAILAHELTGAPAAPEGEPQDVADPMPAVDDRAADFAAQLDVRREADGSVSYACPNPVCPVGRHNLANIADVLPINVVAALVGSLPE